MSWRDRFLNASFRGVQFFVEDHNHPLPIERVQSHRFPGRDGNWPEELGKEPGVYRFSAYLVGEDYDIQADELSDALTKGGRGELVHPYLGVVQVKVTAAVRSESRRDGGYAAFGLEFIDDGENIYPLETVDPSSETFDSGEQLKATAGQVFEDRFTVSGFTEFITTEAAAQLDSIADAIDGATSSLFGAADDLQGLAIAVSDIKNNALDLVKTPGNLVASLQQSVDLLVLATGNNIESFRSALGLAEFGSDDESIIQSTQTRIRQAENRSAMNDLINNISIGAAAQQAISIEYESHTDALAVSALLTDQIDRKMEEAYSDDEYNQLQDLRTKLVNSLPPESQNLPTIKEVIPPATIPSLLLSYQLYGDASISDDIVKRNKIRHPGFLTGRQALEVLSNV